MRTSILAPFFLCLAQAVTAQAITLPAAASGVPGTGSNNFPWGLTTSGTWPGLRIMTIYDSTNLTQQGVNGPIRISGIRWRCTSNATPTGGTYLQATVALASAAVDYLGASTTHANNVNPDYTVVYSGPVQVLPVPASSPGGWYVDVQFTTPFQYDPTLGNDLVVDTDRLFPNNWSGGGSATNDCSNSLASRVYASSLYPNANGVDFGSNPVIEIQFCSAAFTQFGAGCAGSLGVPDLVPITNQPGISPLPQLGSIFGVSCTNAPTGVAFMILGLNNQTWAGGALPLPQDGAIWGANGCFLRVSDDALLLLQGAGTTASWYLGVPNNAAFCGFRLYNQALVLSPGSNAANYVTSNAYTTRIGQ